MKTALLLLCFVALAFQAEAAQFLAPTNPPATVVLAWDPSSSTNVTGYKIYLGPATRAYTNAVNVGNVTNATISIQQGALYFFAATAYDGSGLESDFSNEVSYQSPGVPQPPPNFRRISTQMLMSPKAAAEAGTPLRGTLKPWEVQVIIIPKKAKSQALFSPKYAN